MPWLSSITPRAVLVNATSREKGPLVELCSSDMEHSTCVKFTAGGGQCSSNIGVWSW